MNLLVRASNYKIMEKFNDKKTKSTGLGPACKTPATPTNLFSRTFDNKYKPISEMVLSAVINRTGCLSPCVSYEYRRLDDFLDEVKYYNLSCWLLETFLSEMLFLLGQT